MSDMSNETERLLQEANQQSKEEKEQAYSRRIEEIVRSEIFSDFKFISKLEDWNEQSDFFWETIDMVKGNAEWRNDPDELMMEWKASGKYARSVLNQKRNNAQQQCKVKYLSK